MLPVATYVAVTEKIGPRLAEAIRWSGAISDTRRAGDYYRVVDGDRLLWGGRITTDTREPPRLRDMMRGDILSVYPQLGDIAIEYAWPGIMGYAPHKMPQVGEIEPGLWVCSAFGGHGRCPDGGRRRRRRRRHPGRRCALAPVRALRHGLGRRAVGRAATQLVYWQPAGARLVGREATGAERGDVADMTIERMGASPRRREDARFVTGQGAYLDDLQFERPDPCRRAALAARACADPVDRCRPPPGARRACSPC